MKMNELTMSERTTLDKLNAINLEIESNEAQSLSNVCWGYLHHKFDESLLSEPKSEIKKKLKHINEIAPKIITSGCPDIFDYREGKIFIKPNVDKTKIDVKVEKKPPVIKKQVAKIDVVVKPEVSVKEIEAEIKLEKKSTPKTKKEKVVMNTLF